MAKRNQLAVPGAEQVMAQLKFETAQELGIQFDPTGYNGNMTAREAGAVGGHMVKKLVQIGEQIIANRTR